eukprot:Unigene5407_Nuclearia_a/m.16559 Unigene5407_Nuclearia_a/g.16559  ORF Unigene5407_Nuclearia_a/g.16559 Unigene5407_Nuclearia_a/m.16559 type:complete len:290 (+) Unigene5407_Nuclearia_a:105-974(+)
MDLILAAADYLVFDDLLYRPLAGVLKQEPWAPMLTRRDWVPRQALSMFLILWLLGLVVYLLFASLSYYYFFHLKRDVYYPKHAKQPKPGQEIREIKLAMISAPVMSILTTPIILLELHGYTKLYSNVSDYSLGYFAFSIVLFLIFTDTAIYWIHRLEHDIPWLYKYIHKPHHAWHVPTPYAAIAFHPVDGWLQSLPYHIFPFIFPLHKVLYLALFVFVQLWTISIHDGVDFKPGSVINGALHHTYHHSKFNYNYGQFFTFWDQIGGTYMDPYEAQRKEAAAAGGKPKEQ